MIDRRYRVLPQLRLLGNLGAQVAREGTHVAVRQLEPCLGERVRELLRILVEAPRDLLVGRVEPQREVGRQHRRRNSLRPVMRMRNRALAGAVLRLPLLRTRRTRRQVPVVLEAVLEAVVVPRGGRRAPGDLETARDRVGALACLVAALPAEALFLEVATLRLGADMFVRRRRTMGL